jgi:rubrerythrin
MAIKFEFTLTNEETEVLFDILREQIDRIRADERNHRDIEERGWLRQHAEMLEQMIDKMESTRVV